MKAHRLLFVCLSAALILTGYMFSVPDFHEVITVPQHGYFDSLLIVKEAIAGLIVSQISYYGFFIIDLLWAPTLLLLLYRYLRGSSEWWPLRPFTGHFLAIMFIVIAIPAYLFDILENVSYLFFTDTLISWLPLKTIVDFKNAAYTISFLVVLLFYYQKYVYEKLDLIKAAFKSSLISILTILLLIGLATLMEQGSTVIVHLFDHPLSLLMTIILLNLLAIVSAHYPDYMDKYFYKQSAIIWKLQSWQNKKSSLGIGFITYDEFKEENPETTSSVVRQLGNRNKTFFNHFRKIIGALVMITWLYVLLYVYRQYEIPTIPVTELIIGAILLSLMLHFWSAKVKEEWNYFVRSNKEPNQEIGQFLDEAKDPANSKPEIPDSTVSFCKATLFFFLMLIVFTGGTIVLAYIGSWVITWYMMVLTTLVNIVFIILFQQFRTVINLPQISDNLKWIPIVYLGDDNINIRFFAVMGLVSLFLFLGITFNPSSVSALVIMLLFVFLLYGAVVIMLKHHLYYSTQERESPQSVRFPKTKRFFKEYVPILGVLILGWILFSGIVGNGLHKLPFVDESADDVVTLEKYTNGLEMQAQEDKYLIASYGGGLRASAWTMLLLDTLYKADSNFFDKSLAMSGVSGGFLGLSFYTALMLAHENGEDRIQAIDAIGRHNLLSIDISYLLGFDFVRELIPYVKHFCYRDRAGRSMEAYAGLIQSNERASDDLLGSSYRSYWAKVYKKQQTKNRNFPALIGNTTGTNGQYGIAFSLDYRQDIHLFPGAVDILSIADHNDKSISYLDATSTTERFPIFSPAAEIERKGSFLDGGYFENSGLLSLMNFYEKLEKTFPDSFNDSHTKVIVIINSKDAYIGKVLDQSVHAKSNRAKSEMGAILSTIADISILPLALEAKYRERFGENYIPVYLPYPISYGDVVNFIGGVPIDPFTVQSIIDDSNKKVTDALRKSIGRSDKPIPPALARVLSDPAFDYIKAMLRHEEVESAIDSIYR